MSAAKDGAAARAAAARCLREVLVDGHSLGAVLPAQLAALADSRDRALAQDLAFGALRWLSRLDAHLQALLRQAPERTDPEVLCLLRIGLYQLQEGGIPEHAALSATVQACRTLGKPWATKLVNAVLRGFLRQRDALEAKADEDPGTRYAHPPWLIENLKSAWPERWISIAEANNQRAPMYLRVNRRRTSRAAYLDRLSAEGIAATPLEFAPDGLILAQALPVSRLPGFADGEVSVQDAAAQLAAPSLDLKAGLRVLDACAAPGGKCAHLLELEQNFSACAAVDKDAERLDRVRENLRRLGLEAQVLLGDAADPAIWWDGKAFDRILIDAPCSGTGVIRRHPDIKWLRRPSDIAAQADQQRRILDALWPLLSPGGLLLYVTCSVLPAENKENITQFLNAHPDAQPSPFMLNTPHTNSHIHQILPGENGMDGFFFARLYKRAA